MNERDFELIEMLAKTQNITKTANMLYVTQSSLSKRIQAIETELGISLFTRSRKGIRFTPQGEIVLEQSKKAANILNTMRKTIDANREYVCGTLNIGVSVNYSIYRLPDLLMNFRTQYPKVNTHIVTGQSKDIYSQLLSRKLDVVIIRGEFDWNEHKILIEREKICLICQEQDRARPLDEYPYIGRTTDAVFEREIQRWYQENEISRDPNGVFVDSINTCVEMVKRGLGWSIVPEICLKDFLGHINPLQFKNGEPLVRSTYIMYSEETLHLPQAKAFIDIIRQNPAK